MLMLREFSHRSKINAILEKKMRESRKIAPQNDPWQSLLDFYAIKGFICINLCNVHVYKWVNAYSKDSKA